MLLLAQATLAGSFVTWALIIVVVLAVEVLTGDATVVQLNPGEPREQPAPTP